MSSFETRKWHYDNRDKVYFSIDLDVKEGSSVAEDLMKHLSRYAIKRACDLMAKDEQEVQDRLDAIEYLTNATGLEKMLADLDELREQATAEQEKAAQEEATDDEA